MKNGIDDCHSIKNRIQQNRQMEKDKKIQISFLVC